MKKQYNKPSMEVIKLQQATVILAGSGDKIYGDNPMPPGGAMSPELIFLDDEE